MTASCHNRADVSKNEQVRAQRIGADRSTTGMPSLVQGVYGSRGNLELVVPDADDGCWVFWFNADHADDPPASPDVPPGTWSAGLRFAPGTRYVAASIHQIPLGPDHLEVLALADDGALESWWWSPGPGFQRREPDAASGVTTFDAWSDEAGGLHVLIDGERRVTASPLGYPERRWREGGAERPAPYDAEAALRGVTDVAPGTAVAARSTRDGGTLELAWRDTAGALWHAGAPLS
jgi:hypothetical protein